MATNVAERPRSGTKGLMVWMILAVLAAGGGASLPWIVRDYPAEGAVKKKEIPQHKSVAIPFGDVVVNLGAEQLNRYLRVKLLVAVEESDSKEVTELVTKQKAFLKDWLIGYLFAQSSQDVGRKLGVNRIRREVRDQFNAMLYPNGEEKITDILFDEFVVQ